MKKNLLSSVLLSALAATAVVACSSGSSGSSSPSTGPVNTTQLTAPTGSNPLATTAASPATFNLASSLVYLPASSSGYNTIDLGGSLPTSTAGQFLAAMSGTITNMTTSLTSSGTAVFNNAGKAWVVTPITQSSAKAANATVESATIPTSGITNVVPVAALNTSTFNAAGVLYGQSTALKVAFYTGAATVSTILSGTCASTGDVSSVSAATVGGTNYVGAGTSSGNFCVLNPSSSVFTNLTAQAVNHGYTTGSPIIASSLVQSGSNLYGYWLNQNGQVWEVTATVSAGVITPTAFWQVNSAATQSNIYPAGKSGSVTFTNVPSSVVSIATDSNNNLYAGTSTGSVYKVSSGATNWTNATVGTGSVTLNPSSSGSGAVATTGAGATTLNVAVN